MTTNPPAIGVGMTEEEEADVRMTETDLEIEEMTDARAAILTTTTQITEEAAEEMAADPLVTMMTDPTETEIKGATAVHHLRKWRLVGLMLDRWCRVRRSIMGRLRRCWRLWL